MAHFVHLDRSVEGFCAITQEDPIEDITHVVVLNVPLSAVVLDATS